MQRAARRLINAQPASTVRPTPITAVRVRLQVCGLQAIHGSVYNKFGGSMNLPTQKDINPIPEDLDGQCAVRNFLRKTRDQITREFAEHGMSYQEDLMFMGSRAFCFYFPAAVDYLAGSQGSTDADVANCLVSVVEHRLEYDSLEIRDAFPDIFRFADHLLAHYDAFALDPDIYGDLRPRLRAIRQTCAEPFAAPNGGPASQLGNSGGTEGPPSVS
jgi:hypothetical protein